MHILVDRADVRPGEAWAQTADRIVGALGEQCEGPALAVDLSGDPLVFEIDRGHHFAVRQLTLGDLPFLRRWLAADHVRPWWRDQRDRDEFTAHYGSLARGEQGTNAWVWEVNGRSVGFAQDYRISDHPEYAALCRHPDAVGVDYLLGEAAFVDRGLGTSLLWVYLRDVVRPAYPEVSEFFADPDHRNTRSLRVLDKLGFERGLWFDEPQAGGRVETVIGCSLDVKNVIGGLVTDG